MITKRLYRYLAVAAFVVLSAATACGQSNLEERREQCRMELQRTDEIIVEARTAVQNSGNALGANALEKAEKLQDGAQRAFEAESFGLTLSLTRRAREQASSALSSSRMSEQLEGILNGRLERARENLDRARDQLGVPLDPTAATLHEQGRGYLAQAWEFYRGRQYRACGKMVEQVEQVARRLQNMSRNAGGSEESFQFRYQNVERMIEFARELLADCASEEGRRQIEQAEQSLRRAQELQAEQQPRAALVALGNARQAARRAVRECRDGKLLEQRYQRLVAEQEQLRARLDQVDPEHRSTGTVELLQQSAEQLELANRYLGENEIESALLSLRAAQIALRQAERYLNGEQ